MRRKIILVIITGALVIPLTFLVAAVWQANRARHFGDAFLSDVRTLRVGQSTYDDVSRIQAKYRTRSSVEGGGCNSSPCTIAFSDGNKRLYQFGLVPGARFTGGLSLNQGILVKISLSFLSNPGYDATTDEIIASPEVSPFKVGGKKLVSGRAYTYVWARLTSAATPEERQQAYAFNMACLTKLGGCKNSNEILPILRPLGDAEQEAAPPPRQNRSGVELHLKSEATS